MKTIIIMRLQNNLFPANWEILEESNGWYSVWPLGRASNPNTYFHMNMAGQDVARAAFAVFAPNINAEPFLDEFINNSPNSWKLSQLRADNGGQANAVKNIWKHKRLADQLPELPLIMMGYDYSTSLELDE